MEHKPEKRRMKLIRSIAHRETAEERRLAPMMRALKAIHSATLPESMAPEDLERQRAAQELLGRLAAPMLGMRWEPFTLDGMSAAWVRPERGHDRRRAVLYCHGGGYTSGNLGYSRPLAAKLANVAGWEVMAFEYRLAPEHPFPAAADDAMKAWDYLMYQGYGARDVVVAGDSAGGNMALVLCHRLKAMGRRLPARLILMSPWTDMTASGRSYTERAALDPTITLEYIKAVRAPINHIPLLAVSGVTPENLGDYLNAGMAGAGIGSILVTKADVANEDYDAIAQRAARYVAVVESV